MEPRKDELERFKTEINLTEFAASKGYILDTKQSYSNIVVMKSDNDKINISKGNDGHWIYFSWYQEKGGSIIDFIQHLESKNIGHIRKDLRPWIGADGIKPHIPKSSFRSNVQLVLKDRKKVQELYSKFKTTLNHPYLESRAISNKTLSEPRFQGRVFIDQKLNAIFPHMDKMGLSGFEIKNNGYTGFSKHGEKSVWMSNCFTDDIYTVICETAIDALSYHQLHGNDVTRYGSIGGNPSPKQYELIDAMMKKSRENMTFIVATDNDLDGEKYFEKILTLGEKNKRNTIRKLPKNKDWNDDLQY